MTAQERFELGWERAPERAQAFEAQIFFGSRGNSLPYRLLDPMDPAPP